MDYRPIYFNRWGRFNLPNLEKINLFKNSNGYVSNLDILNVLIKLKADQADILYIHSALNFGLPNPELSRKNILEIIYEVFLSLNVRNLIFPTYTFSFCNNQFYSKNETQSKMGLLNEFVRALNESVRSVDPLMSNVLSGKDLNLVLDIGKSSVGNKSTFDNIHKSNLETKFLFFGPKIGDCFTYMHYIEFDQNVPYRYIKEFTGEIINDGTRFVDTYELFVRYDNVFPNDGSYIYENFLCENNFALSEQLGNSFIKIIDKNIAYQQYLNFLSISPNFFIKDIFDPQDLSKNTTNFYVKDMVAL